MCSNQASDQGAQPTPYVPKLILAKSVDELIDPEQDERPLDEVALAILDRWYSNYHKISLFLGTSAGALIFFVVGSLLKDFGSVAPVKEAFNRDKGLFAVWFLMLGGSLILTVFCVITTYGWYVTGLSQILYRTNRKFDYLGDKFKYRDPKKMGSMGWWGMLSLGTGWGSGILLTVAIGATIALFWRGLLAAQ